MHMSDTILAAAAKAIINKIFAFLTTSWHAMHSSMENTYQISDMLPIENIYISVVTQEWHTSTKLVTSTILKSYLIEP